MFVQTVNQITRSYPNVKALVVGDGPAKNEMQEMLKDGIFTGFLTGEALARAYASSDIFFFPSDTETFGNVTLEAMSSGLPCLVADAAGSKSLVEAGKNGFLANASDGKAFESHLEKLVKDEEMRMKMGMASVEKAKKYAWNKVNKQLLGYYHEALQGNNKDTNF